MAIALYANSKLFLTEFLHVLICIPTTLNSEFNNGDP